MNVDLGGAGPACSARSVRRLLLGELSSAEAARVGEHVAGCARCAEVEREVAREKVALAQAVPFDEFAAGVAAKLARAEAPPLLRRVRLRRLGALAGMAVAAAAAVALVPLVRTGPQVERNRTKGAPGATLHARRGAETLLLGSDARVRKGDALLVSLEPGASAYAVVLLVETSPERPQRGESGATRSEVSVLYQGAARPGPLASAFEWTGAAPAADLVVVYGEAPLDGAQLAARAVRGDLRAPGSASEPVIERRLVRAP